MYSFRPLAYRPASLLVRILAFLAMAGWSVLGLSAQDYYENAQAADSSNARFSRILAWQDKLLLVYQDLANQESVGSFTMGTIRIKFRLAEPGKPFGDSQILVDDIPFSSNTPVPPVFTISLGPKGWVYLAYSPPSGQEVAIVRFNPAKAGAGLAARVGTIKAAQGVSNIKLYFRDDGSAILLATQGGANSYSVQTAVSPDGQTWPDLVSADKDLERNVNMNPSYARLGSKDYLVFQSRDYRLMEELRVGTYQIYLKESDDGGKTWSDGRVITDFQDTGDNPGKNGYNAYDNQRPFLAADGKGLVMLWERGLGRANRQIYYAHLDPGGKIQGSYEKISGLASGGFSPEWMASGTLEQVTWFSSLGQGNRVWLSTRKKGEAAFQSRLMSETLDEALYPSLAVVKNKNYLAFHGRSAQVPKGESRVYFVEPDTRASLPRITPLNFAADSTALRRELLVRLSGAPDASGIVGFSVVLSQNPRSYVPEVQQYGLQDEVRLPALEKDGDWYILARAVDRVGNWSEVQKLHYILDTTPPAIPDFVPPALDEKGFLVSNTFRISWTSPVPADVSSYQYSLQYLGQPASFDPLALVDSLDSGGKIPVMGEQTETFVSRSNGENGWYLAAVWAKDKVGNVSSPGYLIFKTNKFIPSTIISFLELQEDAFGNRSINIQGRGFTSNGKIERIVLDKDGVAPFDYEYTLSQGTYRLNSDRLIQGLALANVATSSYLIGLEHSERGFTFSPRRLDLEKRGEIKYGDFSLLTPGQVTMQTFKPFTIQTGSVVLWIILAILLVLIPVSAFQIRGVVQEFALIDSTTRAILAGKPSPLQLEVGKVRKMKIRIFGLRVKFTMFFLLLVIAVVLLVSLPLSDYTLSNQRTVLARGLQDRLEVMMESIVTSSTNFLTNANDKTIDLAQLVNQGKAMQEIQYITITGQEQDHPENVESVWASTDPLVRGTATAEQKNAALPILKRSLEGGEYLPGRNTLKDALSDLVQKFQPEFDKTAREKLGTIPADLAGFIQQSRALSTNTTPEGQAERQRIDAIQGKLRDQMEAILHELSGGMKSLPAYDAAHFDPTTQNYIFYRPVYFRVASEAPEQARYYRGMVRIGVSTTAIVQQIQSTQAEIVRNILIYALIALASGLVGAIIMSSIIVIPIRRLVRGVEQIKDIIALDVASQDTKFGEFLHDSPIKTRSRDELATLSATISDMVYSLKKGAETNKDLVAGKEIQKMFIPLEKVGKGKGSVGRTKTENCEIFGYYEGAKGVSGDYFYYDKISKDVFACIKCDISGKGIPAALIMVEVATLFMSHFDDWEKHKAERDAKNRLKGSEGDLVPLVRTINDLVAGREFGSKFAAFNIALFNERSGDLAFCNAGDNQVHIYRDHQRQVETLTITKSPAAGMFSSKDFPITFKEDHSRLQFGDILLMFTDGVEESQIYYRTPDLQLSPATEEDIKNGDVPDYCTPGRIDEEFGLERIKAVVAAAQNKGRFTLKRAKKTAFSDLEMTFDFSSLGNTVEETVLALVCVEKIFRLIPDPNAGEGDRIRIDKVVDDFMSKVFVQYRTYFRFPREDFKDDLYREYTHLKEENQFDDLTLLALRKC